MKCTKSQLARELNVTARSIFRYVSIAKWLPDFGSRYPRIGGKALTNAPLDNYQCWVITNIHKIISSKDFYYTYAMLEKDFIDETGIHEMFSLSTYETLYPLHKESKENDLNRIAQLIAA